MATHPYVQLPEQVLLTRTLAQPSVAETQKREWRELMLGLAELWESRGAAESNTTVGADVVT